MLTPRRNLRSTTKLVPTSSVWRMVSSRTASIRRGVFARARQEQSLTKVILILGDEEALALWRKFRDMSIEEYKKIYA